MRILEQHTDAKHPDRATEDVIVVTDDYAAVIDGATDKSGRVFTYAGAAVTSGRFAALALADAIRELPADATARAGIDQLVAALNTALDAALVAAGEPDPVPVQDRPSASVVLYSRARHQVWSVGDCQWAHAGTAHAASKDLDTLTARMRAAVTATYLAEGADVAELAATDPGRAVILPLLRRQGLLANTTGPWSYAVLNGTPVPDEHLHVTDLPATPAGGTHLVLGSDGYPALVPAHAPTWEASEAHLADLLAADPLCIDVLMGTKPIPPGGASFDDRAWLRLALAPRTVHLAGHDLRLAHLEDPDARYTPASIRVTAGGPLPYPEPLATAVDVANDLLAGTEAGARFFDGGTWVFTAPPTLTVDGDGQAVLTGQVSSAGYRAKSLARNTLPGPVRDLLAAGWPTDLPDPVELPGLLADTDPLRMPASGFGFAVCAPDADGTPTVVLHQRSLQVAVNPGRIGCSIAEGLDTDDVVDGALDLWDAVRRGAAEELGADPAQIPDAAVDLVTVIADHGSVAGYQFLGLVHSPTPVDTWAAAHAQAPDGFEAAGSLLVRLTEDGVVDFLTGQPRELVTSPVVALLVRALERDDPASRTRIEARLRAAGW